MLVKIEESVRDVDPAMYLQAHQLVQQRVPSWVESWPEMPAPPPAETSVVVPWVSAPPVETTPAASARPLEAGWPKVRPELLKKVLEGSIQHGTSTTVGTPAVTVAPPAPFGPMLARYCEITYDRPNEAFIQQDKVNWWVRHGPTW